MIERIADELGLFNYRFEDWDEGSGKPAVIKDGRLSPVYHDEYELEPVMYTELKKWEEKKKELKEQILVSSGLWPMPERCPLNPKIFDRVIYDDFTVEKVLFESYPGFYVTGNLYRPYGRSGPFPAILNAHGHWDHGRLEQSDMCDIPTRCANFAKMGFVAFSHDMLGFQDSRQITHFYGGMMQDLWCIGAFGLQLWNSIRSIDFLETLPDVDAERIGCTGASGGGTQTFFLTAVDDRIKASAPVNMVSTYMHGSCNCENAPGLKIGTNNVEIASMTAPRPLLLIASTGDWTKNTPVVEYPAIHSIYELYGKGHQVEYFYQDAGHNYNKEAREKAYNWFARKLQERDIDWKEQDIDFGNIDKQKIFPQNVELPGIKSNKELFELQKSERVQSIQKLWKHNEKAAADKLLVAMAHLAGISLFASNEICVKYSESTDKDNLHIEKSIIGTNENREEIPMVSICKNGCKNSKILLVIHPEGRNALIEEKEWVPILDQALDRGYAVVSGDIFLTGEFHRPWSISGRNSADCSHFIAYNRTDAALRVQDIVTICRYIQQGNNCEIVLAGFREAGLWCLAAMPFLKGVKSVLVDSGNFTLPNERMYLEKFFLPGFLSIGGFETCIRLSQASELILFNAKYHDAIESIKKFSPNTEMADTQKISLLDDFDALIKYL